MQLGYKVIPKETKSLENRGKISALHVFHSDKKAFCIIHGQKDLWQRWRCSAKHGYSGWRASVGGMVTLGGMSVWIRKMVC